ncbi:MAG: ImpA family metalloprotease [Pseudomonadota bacterium]
MLKHAAWLSLALILMSCTASDEEMMDGDVPPTTIDDPDNPDTPPETPPDTPPDPEPNSAPVIETDSLSGQEGIPLSATLQASDSDGDTISFALVDGPKWLRISAAGEVTGTPGGADIGEDPITVSATDGTDTSEAEIDLEIIYDPIEQALRTGDYTIILDETDLTPAEAMFEDFEQIRAQNNTDISEIYKLGANGQALSNSVTDVTWVPILQSVLLKPVFGQGMPLVYVDLSRDGDVLPEPFAIATIGRRHNARFAVLGDNPFRMAALDDSRANSNLLDLMENTFDWLIDADLDEGFDVVIANLPQAQNYPDETTTRDWLTDTFGDAVSYNAASDCDGTELSTCITDDTDLILLSQYIPGVDAHSEITTEVEQALFDGVPVLYLTGVQGVSEFGFEMLDLFNVGWVARNTSQHIASGFSAVGSLTDWQPQNAIEIESIIHRIERDDLNYNLSSCTQYWRCPENADFATDITTPIREFQLALDDLLNKKGLAFPVSEGDRWLGFALLVGDHYRSMIRYPMSKNNTPIVDIVRAMFGDASVFIAREINPLASMGTAGTTNFADHLITNASVTLTPQNPFRTTGVYAFPGETVTVTRTDDNDLTVRLKVHSIRTNANAPFRALYDRPIFLSSRLMPIEPGETLRFTSVHGGPIHAFFSTSDEDVSFEFENVGEHPVWRGPEDSTAFVNALQSTDFSWAEFVTPYFEVHAQRAKMLQVFFRSYASTPSDLSDMIDTYVRDWPHWLAGWEGPGISENPDLQAFAEAHGLTIPVINLAKHMNSDRPSCNSSAPNCAGTSGNPYDANWVFDPISRGDLHELGHGLEFRARHHFEGGDAIHSTTDLYAIHTQYRYHVATGGTNFSCWSLPHQNLYSTIQASRSVADPAKYMRAFNLSSYSQQMAMFVQLFAALENQDVLEDGWQMMPRLNLVTREFQSANNDEKWATMAGGVGFGGMDRTTAFSLSQNDWLLIALSWSAQRDLREYLDMWGYVYSDDALDHVASMNLPALNPAFYGISSRGHCLGLDYNELPIDGRTGWSSNSASSKVASFTPDYLEFATHEHDEMCSFGEPL